MSEERASYGNFAVELAALALGAQQAVLAGAERSRQHHQALARMFEDQVKNARVILEAIEREYPELKAIPVRAARMDEVRRLIGEALQNGAAHHKQWYLEQIALALGIDPGEHEPGIAP